MFSVINGVPDNVTTIGKSETTRDAKKIKFKFALILCNHYVIKNIGGDKLYNYTHQHSINVPSIVGISSAKGGSNNNLGNSEKIEKTIVNIFVITSQFSIKTSNIWHLESINNY